jgi:hypothetical protein
MTLWTILVPTLGRREHLFTRLMGDLLPQTEPYGGLVQVLALWNNGERPLPALRDELMAGASSEYTSFVDDDDIVPEYYVSQVAPRLSGVDYIGWRMQMIQDGEIMKPTWHSLQYTGWWEDRHGYYRDISHLNPIRRSLALEHARFAHETLPGGTPEDTWWARQLRGHVLTQRVIDEGYCMYTYHRHPAASAWQGVPQEEPGTYTRPVIVHPNFAWLSLGAA